MCIATIGICNKEYRAHWVGATFYDKSVVSEVYWEFHKSWCDLGYSNIVIHYSIGFSILQEDYIHGLEFLCDKCLGE